MTLQEWANVPDYEPRATLAIVFTDIIDSTKLARTVGDKNMFDMLVVHFEAARYHCQSHEGFEIKLIGDAYMAVFRSADPALQFALDFRKRTGDSRIDIRVGIHVGQVRIRENDIYGLQVNLAERLSHMQVPGGTGVFVSSSAKRDIESEYGSDHKGLRFLRLSAAKLKGFEQSEKEGVWQVVTPEIRAARTKRLAEQSKQELAAHEKSLTTMIEVQEPATGPPTLGIRPRKPWPT